MPGVKVMTLLGNNQMGYIFNLFFNNICSLVTFSGVFISGYWCDQH